MNSYYDTNLAESLYYYIGDCSGVANLTQSSTLPRSNSQISKSSLCGKLSHHLTIGYRQPRTDNSIHTQYQWLAPLPRLAMYLQKKNYLYSGCWMEESHNSATTVKRWVSRYPTNPGPIPVPSAQSKGNSNIAWLLVHLNSASTAVRTRRRRRLCRSIIVHYTYIYICSVM